MCNVSGIIANRLSEYWQMVFDVVNLLKPLYVAREYYYQKPCCMKVYVIILLSFAFTQILIIDEK